MQEFFVNLGTQIWTATLNKVQAALALSPSILGAIGMFLFGWFLAVMASKAIVKTSEKLKLEVISEKIGLTHFMSKTKTKLEPSEVVAKGVKGYIIFLFFIEATKIAEMHRVAEFLSELLAYIPDLLIALFIILIGVRIGNTMQIVISTSLTIAESRVSSALGTVMKWIVVTFAFLAALAQLQIAEVLINTLFIGFVSMIVLAGGLAFGLGGRVVVQELLEELKGFELKEYKKDHKNK